VRITHGASRLQEVLADRQAALAYGPANFIDGLQQVVRQSVIFSYRLNASIKAWMANPIVPPAEIPEAERQKIGGQVVFNAPDLTAVYHAAPPQFGETQLEKSIQQAFDKKTTAYDTHPSVRERVQLCQALTGRLSEIDRRPAWELLQPNSDALLKEMQEKMTVGILNSLGRQALARMQVSKPLAG
jgi:hypothetical protein